MSDSSEEVLPRGLLELGVPAEVLHLPLAGRSYLEEMGGPLASSYWGARGKDDLLGRQRDEFFLAGNSCFAVAHATRKVPHRAPWRLQFDVVYLFQLKPLAQAMRAVDLLCAAHCYSDAFSAIRALHSRVHQLALFSLSPDLFDEWLKFPRHEKFLDGHMRDELSKHDVHIFPHLYDQFSEVIHGQFQGLTDAGLFEHGLFPEIPAIANMAYVSAKFLMGVAGWVGLCAMLQDFESSSLPEELDNLRTLYEHMRGDMLQPSRLDHLWTMMAEDRHWEKVSKTETAIAKWFDFDEYKRQLGLFHRRSQPKNLGKKYRSGIGKPAGA